MNVCIKQLAIAKRKLFIKMNLLVPVFSTGIFILLFTDVSAVIKENRNQDPHSKILFDYKSKHESCELTTTAGDPVDKNQTSTLNTDVLSNLFFIETMKNEVNRKTPTRFAFPKGVGAYGYFEVLNDVTKYTKAKLFEKIGKRTPIYVRFSLQNTEIGSSDTALAAIRGFSVKFYTEEGNFDLVGTQLPVFFSRDPVQIVSALHIVRPNPKTRIRDIHAIIDFASHNYNALLAVFITVSEYGLPTGYRYMNGYTNHAFELYNNCSESYYARINFKTEQGFKSFGIKEALAISSYDPDFFQRDLYNSIALNNFPCWKLEMDILKGNDPLSLDFDPFDITRLWPDDSYDTVTAGRFCLNRNVENHFEETEKVALNPGNLVPGIGSSPDQVFVARVLAYIEGQESRLGGNFNKLPVNCPMYAQTYNRDGAPPMSLNMKDAPNYYPNNFNGPEPYYDSLKPKRCLQLKEKNIPDPEGCAHFYNEVLKTEKQKQRLMENLLIQGIRSDPAFALEKLGPFVALIPDFTARLLETYAAARSIILPNYVCDINNKTLHPYDTFISSSPIISPVVDKVVQTAHAVTGLSLP